MTGIKEHCKLLPKEAEEANGGNSAGSLRLLLLFSVCLTLVSNCFTMGTDYAVKLLRLNLVRKRIRVS